jgi:hypothetical protein
MVRFFEVVREPTRYQVVTSPEDDSSICRFNVEQNLSLQRVTGPVGRSGPAGRPVHARYTPNLRKSSFPAI